ncbi:MAG: hypothetical protein ACRDNP_01815 [Gaiellaceae bacterium]
MSEIVSVGKVSDDPASAWGSRDRARAAQALGFEPTGKATTYVAQPRNLLGPFELHPQRRPSDAERAQKVDALLKAAGIGQRRS